MRGVGAKVRQRAGIDLGLADAARGKQALAQRFRYSEAETSFRQALELNPNLMTARFNLGVFVLTTPSTAIRIVNAGPNDETSPTSQVSACSRKLN